MAASDLTAAAEPHVNGRAVPTSIVPASNLSPNEMRMLKAQTGRSLTELIGGDPNDMDLAPDRLQAMVYIALRRAGYSPSWEAAGDVIPDMTDVVEAAPDPTSTAS